MQLPHGRFHRIFKSITLESLIRELQDTRFTGSCTIAFGSQNAVLVLNDGQVLLAEYGDEKGRRALDVVLQSGDDEVTAELNTLTSEQMKLAREFNRPFVLDGHLEKKGRKPALQGGGKQTAGSAAGQQKPAPGARPSPPGCTVQDAGASPAKRPAAVDSPYQGEDIDTIVQTMEDMDVERLVSSFKESCKDMLRRIHLEHLIRDGDA